MNQSQILITGANGFLGSNLYNYFCSLNLKCHKLEADLVQPDSILAEIAKIDPDVVFHFGGMSNPQACELEKEKAYEVNVLGTKYIADALVKLQKKVLFVFASSAQVYEPPSEDESREGAIYTEARSCSPMNHYAHTKLNAELILRQPKYRSLQIAVLRIFNITDKSQSDKYILPSLYLQMQKVKQSKQEQVLVGNLEVYRDFTLVQDFCHIMHRIYCQRSNLNSDFEVLNICSGVARRLRDLCNEMLSHFELANKCIQLDLKRVRKNDPIKIVGSIEKLSHIAQINKTNMSDREFISHFIKGS